MKTENKKNAKTAMDNRMAEISDAKQQIEGSNIHVISRAAAQFGGQNSLNHGHRDVCGDFFRQAGR
jgi:hypothetical protein